MTDDRATLVHYAEGQGDAARVALQTFLEALPAQPGFVSADLLTSDEQPDLTLVASRWQAQGPAVPVPLGVRVWVFRVQRVLTPE